MKRRVVFCLLTVLGIAQAGIAAAPARRDIIVWRELSCSEWLLEFNFPRVQIDSLERAGSVWTNVAITGLSHSADPGEPALPQITLWIPAAIELRDLEIVARETSVIACAPPLPAPEPLDRALTSQLTYVPDPVVYSQTTPYPLELLRLGAAGSFGSQSITPLTVCPLVYDFQTETLTVTTQLRLRVTLPPGSSLDQANARSRRDLPFCQQFSPLLQQQAPPEEISQSRIWIITEPDYAEQLDEWRSFKRACGFPSEVFIFSEVASDAASLRMFLQTQYEQNETPAEYLWLVGDVATIPAFFGVNSSLTDHPYSLLAGPDYLPDISVGRLPCNSVSELANWIERALNYERDALMLENGTATVFSSAAALDPQHGIHVNDLFTGANLSTTHLQQPQSGTLPQLINSLNSNPLWAFYIGHGSVSSWSSVAPHLETGSLAQLTDARPAIVLSVACATADFDEPLSSLAESWQLNQLGAGALCYVGATESTAFFYSDTIGLGTLEAIFEQGFPYLGQALDYGKLRCAQSFPQTAGGLTEETIQQFVLLGDPSLRPFTAVPQSMQVDMPELLPIGTTHIPVSVTRNGVPLHSVEVVLSSPTTPPRVYLTNASGDALLELPFTTAHDWQILLRGRNSIPVERDVTVAALAGPLVQLVELEFADAIGDHDGALDRGESGSVNVLLRNSGTALAPAGTLRVQISGTGLALAPLTLPVLDLPAQSEDWLDATLNYSVHPLAVDHQTASLQVWYDNGGAEQFAGNWQATIHAPSIELVSQRLEELDGDGDELPEAGETLRLHLLIANRGGEPLRGAVADCLPAHEYLHILNTRWSADSLAAGAEATITYDFACDSLTPRGYPFEYNVMLSGLNGDTVEFWGHHRIGQVPALLYILDANPQQVPGISAALDVLNIEYEAAQQLPPDLSRFSSIWIFCGVHPNEEPLPPLAAERIAGFLDEGGSCYWEGADVWAFDAPTVLHPYFNITGLSDGVGDAGPIGGVRGRFTDGMSFTYGGENSFVDRIAAQDGAVEVLRNMRDDATYAVCVANAGPSYRTIGCSIELGALNDQQAPSTRVHLVRELLRWFGVPVLHDLSAPVITHLPVTAWWHNRQPIPIFADVQDDSELDFVACDYRVNNGSLETVTLQQIAEGYAAELPAQAYGTRVSYRLRAADRSSPQNTAVTDEFEFVVSQRTGRKVDVVSADESLIRMRKRGASGQFTLGSGAGEKSAVILLNNRRGATSSFVSDVLDLSELTSPQLSFCSYLAGENFREPVICRIMASADGGATFPYLLWRKGPAETQDWELVREANLDELAGRSEVVLKFVYYGDRYWEINHIALEESATAARPVRELVVKPGADMTLMWKRSARADVEYVIYASSATSGKFDALATTTDTIFQDIEWENFAQRFYRVEEQLVSDDPGACARRVGPFPQRLTRTFDGRR